jgi:hypothetical protein
LPYFFTKKKSLLLSSFGFPDLLVSLGDHMLLVLSVCELLFTTAATFSSLSKLVG